MSFNVAISGLNAINDQLGAISNNIANSGTVGFKSGRAEFASLYASSQPLGVGVTGMTQSITKGGSIASTGNSLDLAISGNGFFMVRDAGGNTAFTRAGYFGTDASGNLVNNLGMQLQGNPVDANGNLQTGTVSGLQINNNAIAAKSTSNLDFTANLDARAEVPEVTPFDADNSESWNNVYTTQVYDSLGREHTLNQYYVKTDDNTWEVWYTLNGEPVDSPSGPQTLSFTDQGVLSSPTSPVDIQMDIPGAAPLSLAVNYSGSTQFGSDFSVSKNQGNGYASGQCTGQMIDDEGYVYATYSNGERMLQGQLVLATFANANGLSSQDGTTWVHTSSSGEPIIGQPGTGLLGSIVAGALESSNVDLTNELVGLMTAQRNYQANTKVISTNDNMLSSLFQAV